MKSAHLLTAVTGLAVVMAASPVLAASAGDWILRGTATRVIPDESTSDTSTTTGVTGLDVNVEDGSALGLTAAYFVTDSIAIELLASTPFSHDLAVDSARLGSTDLAGADIGEIEHLPPTLSVQYHLDLGALRPYVGAGVNYTIFFDETTNSDVEGLGLTDLDLDDSVGPALQVGADYEFASGWLVNADVRYIDIDTEATLTGNGGQELQTDVDIDPWIVSLGIGYRF